MIKHNPWGNGHAYQRDVHQRFPIHPVAGKPFEIGASSSRDVSAVRVEVETSCEDGSRRFDVLPAIRFNAADLLDTGSTLGGEGHLAAAQAAVAASGTGWTLSITAEAGAVYRYRFIADRPSGEERTRWFTVEVSAWQQSGVIDFFGNDDRIVPGSVSYLADSRRVWGVKFALKLTADEQVIGFGERFERVNQRGHSLDAHVFEQYTSQGAVERTYLPMPFAHVIGGQGWGFHVRTASRTWYDVGKRVPHQLMVEVELDQPLNSQEPLLECAIYEGDPHQVLDQFLAENGRPQELPEWTFKLWASSNEWNTQAEVERQLALHAEHDIPIGSVVIEAWSDETSFTVFRDAQYEIHEDGRPHQLSDFIFPPDGAWPDPVGMVRNMHAGNVKLILWQIPLIKLHRPEATGQVLAHAKAAVRDNVLVQVAGEDGRLRPYRNRGWWFHRGLMPDLTDERAAEWWTGLRRYLVEEVGVDGFKTDGGEHAWGGDLRYLDGAHGTTHNNLFPVAYAKAYGDLLKSAGKAPVTFSRAGFTGSQVHGAFWAGDERSTWEAFRWSMIAGLNASACGILYWGWDIAGFSGEIPTPELYVRAFAASAFVPIMQYHSEFNFHRTPSNDRTPWNIAERHDKPEVIEQIRDIVALRERLIPYLTEQTRKAIKSGRPLMIPTWFAYPHDPAIWEHPIQWLLGEDILVSPVMEEGVTQWDVYLPEGDWICALSGITHTGGQVLTVDVADVSTIPVFVRTTAWEELASVFER